MQADRSNRFVFATNLGSDQIAQFTFDTAQGRLVPNDPPYLKTAKGEGPRHFQFSPDNRFLYLLSELTGTLTQFAFDPATGTLSPTLSVASVPPDSGLVPGTIQPPVTAATLAARARNDAPPQLAIAAADIQITPDGRFLVTTERTSSKLAVFRLDLATGTPTFVSSIATVTRPRGIRIDPSSRYLIASGEKSNDLAVYRIDGETGDLREVGRYPGGRGANWVEIVDLPAR
ncbi:lactonase family protein [Methylobacterium oryzae CBMB20]